MLSTQPPGDAANAPAKTRSSLEAQFCKSFFTNMFWISERSCNQSTNRTGVAYLTRIVLNLIPLLSTPHLSASDPKAPISDMIIVWVLIL